jgi:uncharacterized PurR-regulated membrane protein YhhQ (DUF165 family)
MTAGIKTTEFWLTLIVTLLNYLVQTGAIAADFPHAELGAFLTNGVVVVTYIISRWIVKRAVVESEETVH